MNKILLALIAMSFVVATPAQASNDDAAWFLGGMVGGFVLNNLTRPMPAYGYGYPQPYPVYQPQPVYQRVCMQRTHSKWDRHLQRRVFWYDQRCRLVPVY